MSVSLIDGHIDDDEMTDEQVIKALDGADVFLRNRANSEPAPLNEYDIEALIDIANVCDEAANLINRKNAKIKALQMDNEQLETDNFNANMNCEHIKNIWESDYQKLSEVITKWKDQYKRLVIQEEDIKAEAVKEFAEAYIDQIENCTGMFTDEGFYIPRDAVLNAVDFIRERLAGDNNA